MTKIPINRFRFFMLMNARSGAETCKGGRGLDIRMEVISNPLPAPHKNAAPTSPRGRGETLSQLLGLELGRYARPPGREECLQKAIRRKSQERRWRMKPRRSY